MEIKLTMFPDYVNWVEGYADGTWFQAKLFDEPSPYGINEGRVSKLHIDGGINYDRGWDSGEGHPLVGPVVDFLETTPNRFYGPQERLTMTEAMNRYKRERGY
ncbi:hypothetical protein [Bacillus sp. ISL-7]|uniref:DUF7678 domain-containing protein n=1 Tax=Bacillus sp. ISL-7 TaxID=2819136 RepID=UPI001BE85699|nr:hypothetical protein [Bacillus sp. ISL-7]MBT2735119.1 hypothetical protein [Bacillus sp. ISL-7]